MSALNYILIIGICLLMACALVYRHKYIKAERERERQHFEDNMNYQLVNGRYLQAIKELADTKAELEQYKNHESETAKVFKPLGKKVTVSTDGAGMGAKASFEVFGLDTELVNDPHNVRYTFWYKGNRYLGYEVVDGKISAYPLSEPVITEAGENVETFLEF